jgi:hypothetical protein
MLYLLYLVLLVVGLIALAAGKIKVSKRMAVQGMQARLVGLLLCAAVPLTYVVTLVVALVVLPKGASAQQFSENLTVNLAGVFTLIGVSLLAAYLMTIWRTPIVIPGEAKFQFTPPGDVRPAFVPPTEVNETADAPATPPQAGDNTTVAG